MPPRRRSERGRRCPRGAACRRRREPGPGRRVLTGRLCLRSALTPMGDEKDSWKVKTLDEILQEKKRRKEQEEKAEIKRLKNVSRGPGASFSRGRSVSLRSLSRWSSASSRRCRRPPAVTGEPEPGRARRRRTAAALRPVGGARAESLRPGADGLGPAVLARRWHRVRLSPPGGRLGVSVSSFAPFPVCVTPSGGPGSCARCRPE